MYCLLPSQFSRLWSCVSPNLSPLSSISMPFSHPKNSILLSKEAYSNLSSVKSISTHSEMSFSTPELDLSPFSTHHFSPARPFPIFLRYLQTPSTHSLFVAYRIGHRYLFPPLVSLATQSRRGVAFCCTSASGPTRRCGEMPLDAGRPEREGREVMI